MHKPGACWRHHSSFRNLAKVALASILVTTLSACAFKPVPVVTDLPAVAPDQAATLNVRSKVNFTDVKHRHLLMIDGIVAGKFKEEDVMSFQIAEGAHKLTMTCHSRYMRGDNITPFNYTVVDGKTALDIDVVAGDSLCLKISFKLLQCAILRETAPSYCE